MQPYKSLPTKAPRSENGEANRSSHAVLQTAEGSGLQHSVNALLAPVRIIAAIAVVAALVIGKSVFIPLAVAVLASMALRPLVRSLETRVRLPTSISAALFTSLIGSLLMYGIYALAEPAAEWLKDAPEALRTIQRQASNFRGPLEDMRETSAVLSELRSSASSGTDVVVANEPAMGESLVVRTSETLAYTFATLVMLFFLLGWGDRLFRNCIALLPGFREQREAIVIAHAVEAAVARYLLTVTVINSCLGAAVAALTHFVGLPNPALWGVVAALLNFMPYIGAVLTAAVLLAVSLVSQPLEYHILTAPAVFLLLTVVEGNLLTPYAVGRSLTLNPLIIFFSLLVCFFLWGGIGALLAVPLLVCGKVVLERSGSSANLVARLLS